MPDAIAPGDRQTPVKVPPTLKLVTADTAKFEELGWTAFASPDEMYEDVSGEAVLGLDTETSGKTSFIVDRLHCIQIGCARVQYVIDCEYLEILKEKSIRKLFNANGKHKDIIWCVHNCLFDLPFLYEHGLVPRNVWDTYYCERIIFLGLEMKYSSALDATLRRRLGVEPGTQDKKEMQKAIAAEGLSKIQNIVYAGEDVRYLPDLREKQIEAGEKYKVVKEMRLRSRALPAIAYMHWCGIGFDANNHEKFYRDVEYREWGWMLKLNKMLATALGEDGLAAFLAELEVDEFQWGSPQQVVALFKKLGIPVPVNHKTGNETVEQKNIVHLQDRHPIIPAYIEYKKYQKLVTTYGRKFQENVGPDKRIHSKFTGIVDTGRISSSKPNLQNQVNSELFRRSFCAQRSNELVVADYSSQEQVVMAELSGDPAFIEFFQSGEADLHSATAKMLWPDELGGLDLKTIKEKHPELRRRAKIANFTFAYNGAASTLAFSLNVLKSVAQEIRDRYFQRFPTMRKWMDDEIKKMWGRGYIINSLYTGLKRHIYNHAAIRNSKWGDDNYSSKKYLENCAVNNVVQGTSASISMMGLYFFWKWILDNRYFKRVKIVLFVHDEIVAERNPVIAAEVDAALQTCMEAAGQKVLKTLKLRAKPKSSRYYDK